MNNLIPINKENERITVSGRELHKFLGITERYSSWFKRTLCYGFEEKVDYVGCKVFNTLAKQELDDHQLTLTMAKEISMVQRNEKGKEARKYFIQCEKELREVKEVIPSYQIDDRVLRAKQWIVEEEERQQLAGQVIELEKTKAQISRKREAQAMQKASALSRKLNKLTENEKKHNEFTALEIAVKTRIYSKTGKPHSMLVSAFASTLSKNKYSRTVKAEFNGNIVDITYYNLEFLKKFSEFAKEMNKDIAEINGRNYKFDKH